MPGPGYFVCLLQAAGHQTSLAYAGADDATAIASEMAGWQRFTRMECRLREFVGGHFFLRDAPDFEAVLAADLAKAMQWSRKMQASENFI